MNEVFRRGVTDILDEKEWQQKLQLQRPLRIKAGFDPTAPDLHFGHWVLFNKLKQFQQAGHEVIFLVGDFTARIGDPTGKNITRKPLNDVQILKNAETYAVQVFKVLDREKTTVRFNSEWLNALGADGIIRLCGQYTLARMLERDDFHKRHQQSSPIGLHELLYPLLQGYDSVALNADVELGGTDQRFNLLVGRELQRQAGQTPQVVMTLPLLEGLDGVDKMSKSLGNAIGLTDPPEEMFGKIMSVSDTLMWRYYELLSQISIDELQALKASIHAGKNPREVKFALALELVEALYDARSAQSAGETFNQRFRDKQLPSDLVGVDIHLPMEGYSLPQLLKQSNLCSSTSDAIRMIRQQAVRIDGEQVSDVELRFESASSFVVQVGKRRVAKLVLHEHRS